MLSLILSLILFLPTILVVPIDGDGQSTSEIDNEHPTHDEIDFYVAELENSVGGGFEPHIIAGPGIDGKEWYYIDSPTGFAGGESGNLWISKDGGESWSMYHDIDNRIDHDAAYAGITFIGDEVIITYYTRGTFWLRDSELMLKIFSIEQFYE